MQPKNIYEPAPLTEMSQMQWRSLQTREFNATSDITIHKAIVTAFQDEGFIVTQRTSGKTVTDDEGMIYEAKKGMARRQVTEFLGKMQNLGFTREDAIEMITKGEQ